ncbi:MAG: flagellar hook assembly protein FlgD [Hyphomonadaceae bacterium]|nr:flagellar hook assembly protein FlgD [Hyphomonadaceae bacterium]
MTVSPIAPNSANAAGARTRLSDNYDNFLVLLTSQLQNQDPLAPMDSTQFTQQLVQFSQVEQQIRTNEQLESLARQYQAATAGSALSYLGRDAIVQASETSFANGVANWAYRLPEAAESVTVSVRDARGREVFSTTTAPRTQGEHLFAWDGATRDGTTAPEGVYTLSVVALDEGGDAITPSIAVRETILGVDFSGTMPLVITPAGTRGFDKIRSVLDG